MPEASFPTDILDGFLVGEPISNRNGIKCCPAIHIESNEQYMVKLISLPASQVQVEAMLLSGACPDEESVASYFRNQADEIVREAQVHVNTIPLHQSHPLVNWEILPMTDGVGCQVILISKYYPTLANELSQAAWTQHQAINMTLDICAALSALRQNGYLYANLKPENIFRCEDGTYMIGDLGGLRIDSLKYTSLPEKYRSAYTAPEIADIFASISMNLDVYALGCILYSLFNENSLPDSSLTPAKHADYALWQIIEKACSADPMLRWEDPDALGHALREYLRQFASEDKPIVPVYSEPETENDEGVLFITEEENTARLSNLMLLVPDEEPPVDILDSLLIEELDPHVEDDASQEDIEQILFQADSLIEHQPPQPVVAPTVFDVTIPLPEIPQEEEPLHPVSDDITPLVAETAPEIPAVEDIEFTIPDESIAAEDEEDLITEEQPVKRKWLIPTIAASIALLLLITGILCYQLIYIQRIDNLSVELQANKAYVTIDSGIKDELLTVVRMDNYGNTVRVPVVDGKAVLSGLDSNTFYRIDVVIAGIHKLVGETSHSFTTATNSEILDFTAICGKIDGSALLSFSVNGPQSSAWTLTYSAQGEKVQNISFSGTTVTVNGLTAGKQYTFTLTPQDEISVSGQLELTYTAQNVVIAENLQATVLTDNTMKLEWDLPENVTVSKWIVRCYNTQGFDQTIETDQLFAEFTIPNKVDGYTVFVTAEGMTNTATITITPDPIVITGFQTEVKQAKLFVKWTFEGSAPEEGWLLTYGINGGESTTIVCNDASATLDLLVGSVYEIRLELPTSTTLIGNTFRYQA